MFKNNKKILKALFLFGPDVHVPFIANEKQPQRCLQECYQFSIKVIGTEKVFKGVCSPFLNSFRNFYKFWNETLLFQSNSEADWLQSAGGTYEIVHTEDEDKNFKKDYEPPVPPGYNENNMRKYVTEFTGAGKKRVKYRQERSSRK